MGTYGRIASSAKRFYEIKLRGSSSLRCVKRKKVKFTMLSSVEGEKELIEEGGLYFRVHKPETKEGHSSFPLVVLVHGRAGDARVKWVFSKYFRQKSAVIVSPQGFLNDPLGGFSWWPVESKGAKASAEDLLPAAQKLSHFIAVISTAYFIDPAKVFVSGFSQGAALASFLSLKNPELFSDVAILCGTIPGVVRDDPQEFGVNPERIRGNLPQYFIFHGLQDKILSVQNAVESRNFLSKLDAKVTYFDEAVGHKVGAKGMKAFGEWVASREIWK